MTLWEWGGGDCLLTSPYVHVECCKNTNGNSGIILGLFWVIQDFVEIKWIYFAIN